MYAKLSANFRHQTCTGHVHSNHRPVELTVRQPVGALDLLGQVAIPLMLFALGVRMTDIDLNNWRVGITAAFVCPLSGLAVALLVAPWLHLEGMQWQQLLVFSMLPPAVLNYMLAEKFNVSPEVVASIVLLGNLASIVTIPAMLLFLI